MGFISIIWMLFGFTLAFSGDLTYFGFRHLEYTTWNDTQIPGLLFATFQMTFAIIAAAIISGALVERIRFGAFLLLISLWIMLVYVPLCYWVWGGGWIERMGAKDFAGGTVVHISSGCSAFVAAAVLGKRKHLEDAKPHNIPFVILGGALLWFGWAGFNGGSAFGANSLAAQAICTTFIAASAGMIATVTVEWMRRGQPTTVGAMTGAVAGLAAITPCAGYVDPLGALGIGFIGSLACVFATQKLEKLSWVDDSLGAFSLHGVGGIAGAILGGIFDEADGVLYCGSFRLLALNTIGALFGAAFSAGTTGVLFFCMQRVMRVRASDEQEFGGLDIHVHGEDAYTGPSRSASLQDITTIVSESKRSAKPECPSLALVRELEDADVEAPYAEETGESQPTPHLSLPATP